MHNSAAHSLRKIIRNNYTNVFFFIFTTIPTRADVVFIYLFIYSFTLHMARKNYQTATFAN